MLNLPGGTYWNGNSAKRRFNEQIRVYWKRWYIRCQYCFFRIPSNCRNAQYSIPFWAWSLSIYINKRCLFTVFFTWLASRIILEKLLGLLEWVEKIIAVSTHSKYHFHFLFLCVLYYFPNYEIIVKPIHLMNWIQIEAHRLYLEDSLQRMDKWSYWYYKRPDLCRSRKILKLGFSL